MLRKTLFALVLGLGLAIIIVAFAVKDRRPVLVCLGDSLTSCGGPNGHYSDYLQRELPDIRVINSGIGGDTLEGAWARFERDVLRYKPRAVLIALGANDFWQNSREVSEMRQDLENMIIELQAATAASWWRTVSATGICGMRSAPSFRPGAINSPPTSARCRPSFAANTGAFTYRICSWTLSRTGCRRIGTKPTIRALKATNK